MMNRIKQNAALKISIFEVDSYLKILKSIVKDKEVKWAIITTKPKVTTLSMLITLDPIFKKSTKFFSTLDVCSSF